jgi:40-residue YVTN family beta-propeller repeat
MGSIVRDKSMKKLAALFLASICLIGCSRYPSSGAVFVTNERDGTVTVIDPRSDTVIDTITTGVRARGIRMSPDGKRIYVALSTPLNHKKQPGDDRIAVFDTSDGSIINVIQVGSDPEQLDISKDEKRLYVSNEDAGTLTIIDIQTGKPLATLVVGLEPEGITLSPDGRWAYVTAETSNTISVVDTVAQQVIKTFLVGARPRAVAFSPDGTRAYVSSEVGQSLSVVDTSTHDVIGRSRFHSTRIHGRSG